jgi:hypothetical protein
MEQQRKRAQRAAPHLSMMARGGRDVRPQGANPNGHPTKGDFEEEIKKI